MSARNSGVAGSIDELRLLVESAAARRPQLTSRLEKAAFLVLLRPIYPLDSDVWRVTSEDGLRFYTVRRGECECWELLASWARTPMQAPASTLFLSSPASETRVR